MAIRILMGKPRTGKSYYAVKHLAETYFYRTKKGWWRRKPEFKELKIVTNIEDLQLPHDNLKKWIDGAGGHEKLFSLEYQKKIHQKYNQVVYLIDEAQFLFPSNFRNNAVNSWLEYHGHLGQDIYFITHALTSLPRHFYNLAELQLQAMSRSTSLFMGRDLRYNIIEGGEIIDKKVLFKKQWVFDLYTSQTGKEVEKAHNPFLKWIVIMILILGAALWNGWKNIYAKRLDKVPSESDDLSINTKSDNPSSFVSVPVDSNSSPADMVWQRLSVVRTFDGVVTAELFAVGEMLYTLAELPYEIRRRGRDVFALMPPPVPEPERMQFSSAGNVPSFNFVKDPDCPTCPK